MYYKDYINKLHEILNKVEATNREKHFIQIDTAIEDIVKLIRKDQENKLIFIGNGGSAAISSHAALDFWKNAGKKAISFNESSLITCISNDFGYDYVYTKPIEVFSNNNDILIAISSSGRSINILNAVKVAKDKGCKVITFSGFSRDNPLRNMGDFNIYTQSDEYGFVELSHQIIIHMLSDIIKGVKLE